jgi:hypothetical protein
VSNLTRNPFVVLAAFVAIFWVLLRIGAADADPVVGAVELTVILTMSVLVVVRVLRRKDGTGGYSQDALMPPRWRRWILDERDDNRSGRQ